MRKILPGVFMFVAGFLMMSCNKNAAPVVDKAQIKADIQTIEDDFAKEVNDGKAENVTYYADDAVSFPTEDMPLKGSKAILEALKKDISKIPEGHRIAFTTNEVLVSSDGNQVVETASFILTDTRDIKVRSGNFISVFEKRGDKYVCVRDIATPDAPKPEN
jgi:ketosteroid isomerase-like protein